MKDAPFLPGIFQALIDMGIIACNDIRCTGDGFFAASKSLADILKEKGILTFFNAQMQERACDRFFDDWYLYTCENVCSLLKMREEEHDAQENEPADGDTPGVTISFIAFDAQVLLHCLKDPTPQTRQALGREINRVVAFRGQKHHPALKRYFSRAEAEAPYLIAECYVRHIASFAQQNVLPVPACYQALQQKGAKRLLKFIQVNNETAGYTVCDQQNIYLQDKSNLTEAEKLAILATHTASTSFHAFAAEVRFHARFLTWYARFLPPFGKRTIYDSAVRADITIDESPLLSLLPYHNPRSSWIRAQKSCHPQL